MANSRTDTIREYLRKAGSRGGVASWKGLTKAQRSLRARKAAAKRKANGK